MKKNKKSGPVSVIEAQFNSYMISCFIVSILMIVLGLILYLIPSIAIKTVSWLIGLFFLGQGAFAIYNYFKKGQVKFISFNLVYGIIIAAIGLFVIVNPFAIANILTVGLGIWLLINGGLKINYAIRLKSINENSWTLTLVVGIISIIFGLMAILNPFAKLVIVEVIGLFLAVYGIIDLTDSILLKKRAKNFINNF